MAAVTYATAHAALLSYLGTVGWQLSSPTLKVRHATSPDGSVRLWFKPQALYRSVKHRHQFGGHDLGSARSLGVDARQVNDPARTLHFCLLGTDALHTHFSRTN